MLYGLLLIAFSGVDVNTEIKDHLVQVIMVPQDEPGFIN